MEDTRETVSSRHNRTDSQTGIAPTRPAQVQANGVSTENREVDTNLHPEAVFIGQPLIKARLVSSTRVSLSIKITLKGRPTPNSG